MTPDKDLVEVLPFQIKPFNFLLLVDETRMLSKINIFDTAAAVRDFKRKHNISDFFSVISQMLKIFLQ